MDDREIILGTIEEYLEEKLERRMPLTAEHFADYLISHGVTVQKQGEADNIKVLFIGIEQPDRTKEIYIFLFDFEINGVDYHYRRKLTPELFENFGYKKEKHGRWEGLEYDGFADGCPVYDLWECSECGEEKSGEDVPDTHPYCPNCGAKMDGEA